MVLDFKAPYTNCEISKPILLILQWIYNVVGGGGFLPNDFMMKIHNNRLKTIYQIPSLSFENALVCPSQHRKWS